MEQEKSRQEALGEMQIVCAYLCPGTATAEEPEYGRGNQRRKQLGTKWTNCLKDKKKKKT